MKRIFVVGLILLLICFLVLSANHLREQLFGGPCPSFFKTNLKKVSGHIDAMEPLRITYLFRLNYGSPDDLDFIAADIGENPRLHYIKYMGDGKFEEDKSFPVIPTEHARDLAVFKFNGKKAFAITDHGIDKMPFLGGQPRIVVQEKSGWTDQSKKLLPSIRSFNFTLAALEREKKLAPDLLLAVVAQPKSGNSLLLESDSEGKYTISRNLPKDFNSPDFCYMFVRKIMTVDGADYLYLGACDRPQNAVLNSRDRILKIKHDKVSLLPVELLPIRKMDASWATVSGEVADLNNDGFPDIVTVVHNYGFTQGGIQIYLNSGKDLQFRAPLKNYYEIGSPDKTSFVPFVKVGDIDGDKLPEILVPHVAIEVNGNRPESIQKFGLFKNVDGESFKDVTQCLNTSLNNVLNVEIVDFDKNGKSDLLLMDYDGRYEIYFNK